MSRPPDDDLSRLDKGHPPPEGSDGFLNRPNVKSGADLPAPERLARDMTVREAAAIAAMQGVLSYFGNPDPEHLHPIARGVVAQADALLAELAKPRNGKADEAHGAEVRG